MSDAEVIPFDADRPAGRGRESAAVASAAARASAERARRRTRPTPLLRAAGAAPTPALPEERPEDQPEPAAAPEGGGGDAIPEALIAALTAAWSAVAGAPTGAAIDAARLLLGLAGQAERVLDDVFGAAGLPDPAVVAARARDLVLGVVEAGTRRAAGDYDVDEFGFDAHFTDTVLLPALRPLYTRWFRTQVRGLEHLPADGPALLVANHSGAIALDSLMLSVAVHDEHPAHRHLRMLGADLLFATPVLGEVARRGGVTLAAMDDALRLLRTGHLVGVWPEGFKGVGKPFSERYKLQRFGRGGFVAAALRTGTPIVPVAIVGAEETYPIIGDMPTLARLLGLPYAPVTPTWPLLGPLGLVPLPSKWTIQFCPPMPTEGYGPAAAEDPLTVFDLTDQVRHTVQQTLHDLLVERRSVFL
ncbi:MAG: lysophospholipid acyltransferase family protein [Kineosporiaceae bacterium]